MSEESRHQARGPERFERRDLRGSRFVECNLMSVVMRAVDVAGADIDAPWLLDGESTLLVNGVDVAPYVDAELDRRFPGRSLRRAEDPAGLAEAWDAVERAWDSAIARAAGMGEAAADASVDGEWSFSQTLRHLVMATDTWLVGAVQGVDRPYHPIGQPNAEYEMDGHDPAVFSDSSPTFDRVRDVFAERQAMVRDFLAGATPELLAEERPNPWAPDYSETVGACLRTIIEESWEHLRFAVRDLDALTTAGE